MLGRAADERWAYLPFTDARLRSLYDPDW